MYYSKLFNITIECTETLWKLTKKKLNDLGIRPVGSSKGGSSDSAHTRITNHWVRYIAA